MPAEPAPAAPAGTADELIGELAEVASRGAMAAGRLAASGRRRDGAASRAKSTSTDLVTVHDQRAEALLVDTITSARPDDAIVGEEGTNRSGTSGVTWYLDPIDGTTNFVYDLPGWATSVAAGTVERMLVGSVYVPSQDELFAAQHGRGATLNGDPIAATDRDELGLALVATGFGYRVENRLAQATALAGLIGDVRDIRRFGAASVDLCLVACGRVDAYFERGLNVWDCAAGELIAVEAGCRTGDFNGGRSRPDEIVVAAPGIFDALVELLSRHSPGPGIRAD